jgi:prolyl-tRNA editing enzyme YbaK/EbsC (Cys-tRNA(Pro) deacylase)
VTVAQFAMHTGVRKNGHAVVVLDCASVFGPNASFELAAAATSFVKTVFERCLLCGFGVASDARRLAASYPDRFFSCSFGSDGSKQAHEENITVTTVCVRDVSITLGASAQTHASSLSNLCASVLGPNDALDKTEQVSGWDARPLRRSQILYAAYDALAPRCVLVALLEKRAKRMFEGDVADACVPWTKKETLGAAFLQTLKEKTENDRDGRLGDFLSSTPPRTDADVRRALTRLGALTQSDEILADAEGDVSSVASPLVMVEGWSTSSLNRTTLLCKTLAVVAESSSDGNVFLAATCVLPAFDSIRLDLAAAAEALLGVDVSSPSPAFRLRLANTNELHELFGFAAGSVGPFGLRDSVKSLRRLTVMDESLFVEENAKKTKLSCGSSLVAVGGGAPDVKVVGTAQAVAKHADASVARLTARNL